jgi:hypothetical protein
LEQCHSRNQKNDEGRAYKFVKNGVKFLTEEGISATLIWHVKNDVFLLQKENE